MTNAAGLPDTDLHAFIDGELDATRAQQVADRITADPALARRVAAYRQDAASLADALSPVAERPLPAAWAARIHQATSKPHATRHPKPWILALAASVLLVIAGGIVSLWSTRTADTLLADAVAARSGILAAEQTFTGDQLPGAAPRDALLQAALHMPVRAPDLHRFGFSLVELDTYGNALRGRAAGLVYRDATRRQLTIFVRASSGDVRFDLLKHGDLRTCVWQDDVVGAVLMAQMSAGEMMRVASSAYSELNL